ncbi:MAG: SRPBCC domain-containing protein, partial [Acidimicrobiales bacterium]|nr:SRPBCC domain-containing protein [Acidimicrobiales bacterium]
DGPRLVARFERTLPHPPEKVWRAITEAEHLHHWFPADLVGERNTGATLDVVFWPEVVAEHGIDTPVLAGRIVTWEPTTIFEWSWETDTIRFELAPVDSGTQLTLTVTLVDHHADGSTGYHLCLDALAADLDGHPILLRQHDPTLEERYRDAIQAMRAEVGA